MSEILGWRCEDREFNRWLTDDGSDVESARLAGCRITPLVAAPPEGYESAELAECRDRLSALIAEGDADAGLIRGAFGIAPDGRSLTDQLLSIAPPEGAPTWEQMADWISRQGIHSEACLREQDEGGHCICGLDAITQGLSRIPKDTA